MIDELIHHCIEEIGYDGEAGTELDRLQQYIHDFHHDQSQRNRLPVQRVDDDYRAFVVRALLVHADVHVGTHVAGVPPQAATKSTITRKVERGGKGSRNQDVSNPAEEYDYVDIIDDAEARHSSLPELQRKYGSDLRLVLSGAVIRRMLAGSAEKVLTPSNYRFLQLVCRSREHAIFSTDLGSQLRFDQKTVFYLAKKLIDVGLIIKLKSPETGTSASLFVATKFRDKCPVWLRQQDADSASAVAPTAAHRLPSKRIKVEARSSTPGRVEDRDHDEDVEVDDDDEHDAAAVEDDADEAVEGPTLAMDETDTALSTKLFEPLDAEMTGVWFTSRPDLTRLRIYTYMDLTTAKVALRAHLQPKLGFANSPQRLRRAFQALLAKMVVDGLIEVVRLLTSDASADERGPTRKGLRMTDKGELELKALAAATRDNGQQQLDPGDDGREQRARASRAALERELRMREIRVTREVTVERQAHELVANAGSSGMTLRQMQNAFNVIGQTKRTIEMLVMRSEEASGGASLGDMRIRQFHEYLGRERRLRLYSQHAWALQAANEGFLAEEDAAAIASAGGFPEIDAAAFFADVQDAIAKTRALVSDAFVDTGKGLKTALSGPADDDAEGSGPSFNAAALRTPPAKPTGRPRGRLNNKTIERMKREDAEVKGRSQTPAESTNPVAVGDDRVDLDSMPATPAQSAAKRRKIQAVSPEPQHASPTPAAPFANPSGTTGGYDDATVEIDPEAPAGISGGESVALSQASPAPMQQPESLAAASASESPAPQGTAHSTPARRSPSTPRASAMKKEPRTVSEKKPRSNVTELRSTIALVECIEEVGGVLDSLLVPQELDAFVERNKDRYSSQVLNLREKRVRDKTIGRAIDQGTLKRTFVKLLKPGDRSQRTIVYVPSIDTAVLQRYCDAVVRGEEGWSRAADAVSVFKTPSGRVRLQAEDVQSLFVVRPWQDEAKLDARSFEADPTLAERMRTQFLAQERPMKQFLGHLAGSMARLALFHLACINAINAGASSRTRQIPSPTIDISYFWTEVSLELFLAICGPRAYDPSLEQAYLDPAARHASVSQLTSEARDALGLAKNKAAPPPRETQTAVYSLAAQLTSMTVAEAIHDDGDATGTPSSASRAAAVATAAATPSIPNIVFELKSRIPLYDWKAKGSVKPVLSTIDVGLSQERARSFWQKTGQICLGRYHLPADANAAETDFEPITIARGAIPDLLTPKAWRTGHLIRTLQRNFLLRFLQQPGGGHIPSDAVARLASRICLVPVAVVKRFWTAAAATSTDGVRSKSRRPTWPLDVQGIQMVEIEARETKRRQPVQQREGRNATLRKARELRARRVQEFDQALADAFQKTPAAEAFRVRIEWALRPFRKRYVESHVNFTLHDARQAIQRIFETATGTEVKLPAVRRRGAATARAAVTDDRDGDASDQWEEEQPPQDAGGANGHHGGDASQRKARRKATRKKGRNKMNAEDRTLQSARRSTTSAHYWTPQKNELLRDAAVILRARDRVRGRSDWSALTQLLDEGERSKNYTFIYRQWRLQLARMRNEFGEEGYLSALERKWAVVSAEARRTGELSDPEFPSATEFDLKLQVDFLRARIDKNAIFTSLEESSQSNPLPLDLARHDFTQGWQDEFRSIAAESRWDDFHTQDIGNVHRRFGMLLGNAFVLEPPSAAAPVVKEEEKADGGKQGAGEDEVEARLREELAESAVRAVVLSDDQRCSETDKADFCERFGEDEIESAVVRMLEAKAIRPTTAEVTQRRRPGTNFVMVDDFFLNVNDVRPDRPPPSSLDQAGLRRTLARLDSKLEHSISTPLYVEPVETDGEAACLGTLLSHNLMRAEIDVAPFADLRGHHAFNARTLNDDEIEAVLSVSISAVGLEASRRAALGVPTPPPPAAPSNVAVTGNEVAEAESWLDIFTRAPDDDLAAIREVKHLLDGAGTEGIALAQCLSLLPFDPLHSSILHRRDSSSCAPAFLAGTTSVRVIPARFYHLYTLPVLHSSPSTTRVLPRLWRDIHGAALPTLWCRLLDHVASVCIQRPGISLESLYVKFAGAASAVEVLDVVLALAATQKFEVRWTEVEEVGGVVGSLHPKAGDGGIWAGFGEDQNAQTVTFA